MSQEFILNYLRKNKKATSKEIAEAEGRARSCVVKCLKSLRQQGLVNYKENNYGSGKGREVIHFLI